MGNEGRMARMTSLMRRRGIVLPSFEIYGGVSGLVDYGPIGAKVKRRVVDLWIEHWTSVQNIVEIDSNALTPEEVLVASGHVGEFNDLMTECGDCGASFRSDHLLQGRHPNPDNLSGEELDNIFRSQDIACPGCGKSEWSPSIPMNLMFRTKIGAMKGNRDAYLRPETAQGIFMLFPVLLRHFRQKLPFGALQTGRGYRNEISPRQGMIRLREFNMAELEYFIDPENPPKGNLSDWTDTVRLIPDSSSSDSEEIEIDFSEALEQGIVKHPTVAWFLAMTNDFLVKVGIDPRKIRFRQHEESEMAHYASDCWDCEIFGEHGWVEVVGIANRTCHDLLSHEDHSGSKNLRAWRSFEVSRNEERERVFPVASVIGPKFKEKASEVTDAMSELISIPEVIPFDIHLEDGTKVEITADMFVSKVVEENITGEYFTPHVIEPSFGIDRIIWHILDHAFTEIEKEDSGYTILSLDPLIAPYDVVILPLFDKDGMDEMAKEINNNILKIRGVSSFIDTSRSIGRRYARADEIGIPWAVTIDHSSLDGGTVTIRRRDDQVQVRASVENLLSKLSTGTIGELF